MAAPSYTSDLGDVSTAESITNWAEPTATGWTGGGSPTQDIDYPYIQGSYSVLQATSKSGVAALLYNYGSGITIPTDGAFLVWQNCYTPTLLDSYANGGLRVMVGSSLADFKSWDVGGSNAGRMPYGGWQNHAVNPTVSADDTLGTPSSTLQYIGAAVSLTAGVGKGYPHNVDVIRYGRCEARINGGDLANGYATFSGYAAYNDDSSRRLGLIQAIAGGYLWKGLITLGYSSAVDFRDSNKIIFVDDTRKVTAAFNKIEVKQSGSRVDWTGISFIVTSPSTTASKGRFECVDDADVNIVSCTFVDMDTFIFKGNSTIEDSVFRRCGLITQGGAIFDGCTFDQPSGAVGMLSDDLNDIDNCSFISDGTGHAIELTTAHAGTSKTLTNVFFSGYGADGTDNAAIYNNSNGAVTITITGGDTPTVKNGSGASTTLVTSARSIKVIAQTADGTKIQSARVLLRVSESVTSGFPYDVTVTIANSGTTATVTHTGHGLATNDKVQIKGASHWQNNGVFSITKINDDSYSYTLPSAPGSNPTGTIKSTFVFLEGTTDSNGEISMSKAIGATQGVVGWARKSSAAPYYKEGSLAGDVVNTGDTTFTAILSPDE